MYRHREKKKNTGGNKNRMLTDAVLPRGENMNEFSNLYIFLNFAKFVELLLISLHTQIT